MKRRGRRDPEPEEQHIQNAVTKLVFILCCCNQSKRCLSAEVLCLRSAGMGGEPENNNSSIVVLPFFFTNYFNLIFFYRKFQSFKFVFCFGCYCFLCSVISTNFFPTKKFGEIGNFSFFKCKNRLIFLLFGKKN